MPRRAATAPVNMFTPKRLDVIEITRARGLNVYEGRELRVVRVHDDGRVELYDDKLGQHVGYHLTTGPERGYGVRLIREA